MSITIVQVTTPEQWHMLKPLLTKLFEGEHSLRPKKPSHFTNNIDGPFSYIKNYVDHHEGIAVLAMDEDQAIGFGAGWVTSGDDGEQGDNRRGYFSDAYVMEEYREQGIYKQIIEARKAHFLSIGVTTLSVETLGTNLDMQHILEKCGFLTHKIFYEMKI